MLCIPFISLFCPVSASPLGLWHVLCNVHLSEDISLYFTSPHCTKSRAIPDYLNEFSGRASLDNNGGSYNLRSWAAWCRISQRRVTFVPPLQFEGEWLFLSQLLGVNVAILTGPSTHKAFLLTFSLSRAINRVVARWLLLPHACRLFVCKFVCLWSGGSWTW